NRPDARAATAAPAGTRRSGVRRRSGPRRWPDDVPGHHDGRRGQAPARPARRQGHGQDRGRPASAEGLLPADLRRPGLGDRRPHPPRREGNDRAGHDQPRRQRRVRQPGPGGDQGADRLARRLLRRAPHPVPAERCGPRSDRPGERSHGGPPALTTLAAPTCPGLPSAASRTTFRGRAIVGRHRRGLIVAASLALSLLTVAPVSAGTPQRVANTQAPEASGSPEDIGQWTHPFEEGGAETPRCHRKDDLIKGEIFCKVAAVTMAALPDGRIYYANGIEADENVKYSYEFELGDRTRADRVRVLDLRGSGPKWTTPAAESGASWNPQVKPGATSTNGDPFGYLGTPGRPGDGFVGSKWGKLGGPPQQPSSPPDDRPYKERSTFCADIAQLGDGRVLMAGGTDYYNEPDLMNRNEGAPADVGFLELEGLRASWIFDPKDDSHTATAPMKYGRWYPTLVTMPDGKITVFSGVTKLLKSTQLGQVRRTETFDPATNEWTVNYVGDESETALPLFSRLNLLPSGKILFNGVGQNFGPNGSDAEEATTNLQKLWDPTTKKWSILGVAPAGSRGSAIQVMLPLKAPYNEASILDAGGTIGM